MEIRRLGPGDAEPARNTFAMMSEVFNEEPWTVLEDRYLRKLLGRKSVWIVAAFEDGLCVGGLTAHLLPMTRAEVYELLIYDLAVRPDRQRRGIGRALVDRLRSDAASAGVEDVWVPADNDDDHALDFYRSIGGSAQSVTIFTFAEK